MRGFLLLEKQLQQPYTMNMDKDTKQQKQELSWKTVHEYIAEKSPSGRLMAIVETDKILQKIINKRAIPGSNIDEQIKNLEPIVENYKELLIARKTYQKIISDIDIKISNNELEKILEYYSKSIQDITTKQKPKNIFSKTFHKIKNNSSGTKKILRNAIIAIILFFLAIYLADTTETGKQIWQQLINISHTLFSWVLFTFLIAGGILIALMSTFFYFERKDKRAPVPETDE